MAQQCDSGATFSGPIVITQGGAYTGNWQSIDPTVPAVKVHTGQPAKIVNSRIKGPGDLIYGGSGSDIVGIVLTVQQTCFVGTNPNVVGRSKGSGIWIDNVTSLLVQNCDFESTGIGVTPHTYAGDHTVNSTIRVLENRFHNLDGRRSDGNGGYQPATADNDGSLCRYAGAARYHLCQLPSYACFNHSSLFRSSWLIAIRSIPYLTAVNRNFLLGPLALRAPPLVIQWFELKFKCSIGVVS